jgi:hypothetical protein
MWQVTFDSHGGMVQKDGNKGVWTRDRHDPKRGSWLTVGAVPTHVREACRNFCDRELARLERDN